MRGKITVAVILIGSALFYWYAFWFFNSLSPADVRFNINRQVVPDNVSEQALFPQVVLNHTRQSEPVEKGQAREATYTVADGTPLRFAVVKFADAEAATQSLADEVKDCTSVPHTEAKFPYTLIECKTAGLRSFRWVNGIYRFEAETSIEELLLRFVNNYPY